MEKEVEDIILNKENKNPKKKFCWILALVTLAIILTLASVREKEEPLYKTDKLTMLNIEYSLSSKEINECLTKKHVRARFYKDSRCQYNVDLVDNKPVYSLVHKGDISVCLGEYSVEKVTTLLKEKVEYQCKKLFEEEAEKQKNLKSWKH